MTVIVNHPQICSACILSLMVQSKLLTADTNSSLLSVILLPLYLTFFEALIRPGTICIIRLDNSAHRCSALNLVHVFLIVQLTSHQSNIFHLSVFISW